MKIMHQKGFTLVELVVTIAIFAIIASIAAPSFSKQLISNSVNTEARDLVSFLTEERAEAILKQQHREIKFSASGGGAHQWSPKNSIEWSDGIPDDIKFNPLGGVEGVSEDICILLQSQKDEEKKAVVIVRTTGSILYEKSLSNCPDDD